MPEIPLGNVVGPHFMPSVSADGDLSWTNNGDLPNPATVNIKGPKGDTGTVSQEDLQRISTLESGKVDKEAGKGLSTNDYTDADKAKVAAALTQHQDISGKVDKEDGKGLSTNDYTDAEKNKLSGIAAQANKTIIDTTLSNAGQAADAKTTGDSFSALWNLLSRMEIYCTASGNPATFSDADAANMKNLRVTLMPTQSGSGDPYPPGGGKNLFDITAPNTTSSNCSAVYDESSNSIRVSSTAPGSYLGVFSVVSLTANTTYTLSVYATTAKGTACIGFRYVDSNSMIASTLEIGRNGLMSVSYTPSENIKCRISLFCTWDSANDGDVTYRDVQLEMGSSATDYAPYSNIRPISGASSVNVTRTGKNLWGGSKMLADIRAVTGGAVSDDAITFTGVEVGNKRFSNAIFFKENTQYTIIIAFESTNSGAGLNMKFLYSDGSDSSIEKPRGALSGTVAVVSEAGKTLLAVYGNWHSASTTVYTNKSGIFEGVLTVNDFEPYQGQSATVPLADSSSNPLTVYGGALDVTTGTLSATHGVYTFTGNETWTVSNEGTFAWVKDSVFANTALLPPDIRSEPEIICEALAPEPYLTVYNGAVANGVSVTSNYSDNINGRFCISIDAYNNRSGLTGTKIVYRLATPVTYQLTPAQLATLRGYNAVSADAGSVNVTYKADTNIIFGGG